MENKFLRQKMVNLVVISTKDRVVFSKLNSAEMLNPLSYFSYQEILALFEEKKAISVKKSKWIALIEKLEECTSFSSFIKYIREENLFLPKIRINSLENNFVKNKEKAIQYIKDKYGDINKMMHKINILAKNKKHDSGGWHFYLARYFLAGNIPNTNEYIKAPILFEPIKYNHKNQELIAYDDAEIIVNEKLMVQLIKSYGRNSLALEKWMKLKNIEEIISFLNENFGFTLTLPTEQHDFTNEDVPSFTNRIGNDFFIEDAFIMGLMIPTGGSLKRDLFQIINEKADVFNDKNPDPILNIYEQIFDPNKKIYQISPLNLSQLSALYLAMESNTIIHGPPGTGKSETIANILANVLLNNKSALMVSEKKAALDVLVDRLGDLKDFGIFFQDSRNTSDKRDFYNSILKLEQIYKENKDNYKIKFDYTESVFENDLKRKELLWKLFRIWEQLRTWKIDNFDFENYLSAKSSIDPNIYKIVLDNEMEKLSKKDYFSLKSLINFLREKNLLDSNGYHDFFSQINNNYQRFYKQLEEINKYWAKFDIKWLSVVEIKKIEESQSAISQIFAKHPDFAQYVKNDLFYFARQEENLALLYKYCDQLKLSQSWMISLLKDPNLNEMIKLSKKLISSNKKMLTKWALDTLANNSEDIGSKRFEDWKKIEQLLKKMESIKFKMSKELSIYLDNKEILEPINILFNLNKFLFEPFVTVFIENDWLKFGSSIPLILNAFKLEFKDLELINKTFWFEHKFLGFDKNLELIKMYQEIENQLIEIDEIDWKLINKEIYLTLINSWVSKIGISSRRDEIFEIFRVANLKRLPQIRPFIREHFDAMKELFPIWITTPDNAADIIYNKANIFDFGIFDEASQMFLERAYPILYRTKVKIVAGDQKQLRPTSFFTSRVEEELDDEDDVFEIDFNDTNDLLTRAILSDWNEILLNNHYRSISQDLIDFSNRFIYDSKLNIASMNTKFDSAPLEIINVEGFFSDHINKEEAQEVLTQLELNVDKYEKILIITFNISQSVYITSLLEKTKNKQIKEKFKLQQIVITNLENVQGNEGDLAILSISYARSRKTYKLRASFGPLNMDGGKNRLNVALTRAKQKMIIIKSFSYKQLPEVMNNENAQCFRDFIEFCDLYSQNYHTKIIQATNFDNEFVKDLYNQLLVALENRKNLKLVTKLSIGTTFFDIAILSARTNIVKLGIKIKYWNINDWKERKNILQLDDIASFIKSRKYNLIQVNQLLYRKNPKSELKKIISFLDLLSKTNKKIG